MTLPTAAVVRAGWITELGTSTAEDTLIATMITRADAVLAAWCGFPVSGSTDASATLDRTLESASYTEFHDGPSTVDPGSIALRVRPVTTLTTIHDDTDRDWSYGAADLVSSGDYVLDARAGRVHLKTTSTHGAWGVGSRILKVVYTAGYDTGSHEAIGPAIGLLVAHWWRLRHRVGGEGYTSSDGVTTAAVAAELIPEAIRAMLMPYRLVEVGLGG